MITPYQARASGSCKPVRRASHYESGDAERMKRLLYFLLGFAVPVATLVVCQRMKFFRVENAKKHRERLQEIAVEDSFPASDPPATW